MSRARWNHVTFWFCCLSSIGGCGQVSGAEKNAGAPPDSGAGGGGSSGSGDASASGGASGGGAVSGSGGLSDAGGSAGAAGVASGCPKLIEDGVRLVDNPQGVERAYPKLVAAVAFNARSAVNSVAIES